VRTSWLITDKGDPDARMLVDGESIEAAPHYSRQTPGARMFTRNGQNLVFITADARAVWVTFRPTPGKAKRQDGLDAWECALFRNETKKPRLLSSDLIREAVELSRVLWGPFPADGFITFIKPSAVRPKKDVGYCYLKAGWEEWGTASDGKPRFRAPLTDVPRPAEAWKWKGDRGGKLRREFEEQGLCLEAA
jgi:hypothetical protein